MKAVLYEAPKSISFRDVPDPVVDEDTILIKVSYSFICATDIKTYKQGHPHIVPPTILGHEFSGIVESVGKNVDSYSVGDCVTGSPFINCGVCDSCFRGRPEVCSARKFPSNGAFAERIAMSSDYAKLGLVKVPPALLQQSALSEPLACVLNSARSFNPQPGDSILVVGAGFMGVLNALALKSIFGAHVYITDTNAERLKLPLSLGIEIVDNLEKRQEAFDTIILTPPIPELIIEYQKHVVPFGHIVLFGGYAKGTKALFDPNIVHYTGAKIVGTSGFSPFNFKTAASLIVNGAINLNAFMNNMYDFSASEFQKAFVDAMEGRALKAGFIL
ncbi:MAG: alcohol dehydrogenase catalytic domain-containing protein [Spirochaetales bacterium]|jgi:L-iditol 2-dehydrogenase|nr:alcohol dehydrogenase catalytic domain-containing protein [Spirochaetales bacterium]